MASLDAKIPEGPIAEKWTNHKNNINLVSPANKRQIDVIVVGTGLAGGSAAATLAELGYNVKAFCFQDSPRRAHSIAAQGGINAAKNYQGDGDSTYRLFYDTVKGGDYRSREANVYRLAEVSTNIIDQCVAQGVPFARDYGGLLDNRSFGGVLVSRTFYAKGQTGQQLLLGAYSAMNRQIGRGKIKMYNRHEMLDLVKVDGKARGIITRNLVTGEIDRHAAHAVVIASGGYGNLFYLSTNAMGSNVTSAWKIHKQGAYFANPCFTQIHPTCIPVSGGHQSKLTLMSESLRNDGRIWVPKKKEDAAAIRAGKLKPTELAEEDRDYYLERRYPAFGNLVPRDVASRASKERCDKGYGVNKTGEAVYLDFADASDLGDDESGNGNDFTEGGITAADQATDTPTNNFCTWNPLVTNAGVFTYTEGATKWKPSSGNWQTTTASMGFTKGKWYAEFKMDSNVTAAMVGVQQLENDTTYSGQYLGYYANTTSMGMGYYNADGKVYRNTGESAYGASYPSSVLVSVALEFKDDGTANMYVAKDGTWQNSADPANGTGGSVSYTHLTLPTTPYV